MTVPSDCGVAFPGIKVLQEGGGQVLSVRADEPNKVFGVSFRTPVSDSTGVPHVLEHSVLCGSEKYPLREPFVELLKSSVQTFLNAFTYPDRTCYPVSSQNDKVGGAWHRPQVPTCQGWPDRTLCVSHAGFLQPSRRVHGCSVPPSAHATGAPAGRLALGRGGHKR